VPEDILLLRAQVLARAVRLGAVGGCEGAAALSRRLAELGDLRVATQLWRDHCPEMGRDIVADGNFKQATLSDTVTPFDWQFGTYRDVKIGLMPVSGDGRGVSIITTAPSTRIVASQFLVLPAGRYRLSWRSDGHTSGDTPVMLASLDCNARSNGWLAANRDPHSGQWFADVTVGDACQGKWLNFAVRPGVGASAGARGGQVTLSSVALNPLSRPARQ
jgi:hypothetical protein